MVGREVQRVEVVPLGLDLRSLGDLIAHADEDVGEPLGHRRDRVPGSGGLAVPGQRDVHGLLDQHAAVAFGLQLVPAGSARACRMAARAAPTRLPASARAAGGSAPISALASVMRRPVAGVRQPGGLELIEVARRRRWRPAPRLACAALRRATARHLHGVVGLIRCGHRPLLSCGSRTGSWSASRWASSIPDAGAPRPGRVRQECAQPGLRRWQRRGEPGPVQGSPVRARRVSRSQACRRAW